MIRLSALALVMLALPACSEKSDLETHVVSAGIDFASRGGAGLSKIMFDMPNNDTSIDGVIVARHLTERCKYDRCSLALMSNDSSIFVSSMKVACAPRFDLPDSQDRSKQVYVYVRVDDPNTDSLLKVIDPCFEYELVEI
jgi:hypothetical protein